MNIKQQNIQVANGFEGNQTALDLLGGGNVSQDSGVKYQANSPIYKSPIYRTCIGHSNNQSNEETSWVSFKARLNFSEILFRILKE